jgi:hypothetical protein
MKVICRTLTYSLQAEMEGEGRLTLCSRRDLLAADKDAGCGKSPPSGGTRIHSAPGPVGGGASSEAVRAVHYADRSGGARHRHFRVQGQNCYFSFPDL